MAVGAGDRVRMDDPQIHAGDPARVRALTGGIGGDGQFGGDLQAQSSVLVEQGHRPHPVRRVGNVAVQTQPQRCAAGSGTQPQPSAVQSEGAVVPAHRHQPASAPRKPHQLVPGLTAFRRREPRIRKPAQHRPGTRAVKLTERARPGRRQLPTQLLITRQRGDATTPPPPVDLQHARPHITRRTQQTETPPPLPTSYPHTHPSRAIHHRTSSRIPTSRRSSRRRSPAGRAPTGGWLTRVSHPPSSMDGRARGAPGSLRPRRPRPGEQS